MKRKKRKSTQTVCDPSDAVVQLQKVVKRYGAAGENMFCAVDRISLEIRQGEFVAVTGTSGSGKSTLMHMIGGVEKPTSGTVHVCGEDLYAMPDAQLAAFRCRKIGMVFQFFNLIPVLNIEENVVFPAIAAGEKPDFQKAEKILHRLGLPDRLFRCMPNQLSGGQQQRVAIARAILQSPALILADEPTGNLDSANSEEVMQLLEELRNDLRATLVVVTHDERIARRADRVLRIEDGKIVSDLKNDLQ